MIPVPNPPGSKGLIAANEEKKTIGVTSRTITPDQIRLFLFLPETLKAIKFVIPNANTIIKRNKISI